MAQIVIDVSSHQNPAAFDFAELKKHISGAILRVGRTYWGTGNSYGKDEQFEVFYRACKQHGIPVGAYWYSCADTVAEGTAEANACYEMGLKGKTFELPIYWDTEDNHHQRPASSETLTATGRAFCKRLEALGYYAGIYASSSWLYTELNMKALADIDVWVAHYGVSKPSYTGAYGMWQYTSTGRLPGYSGGLDLNVMYQDYPAIIKAAGLNGYTKPAKHKEAAMGLKGKNVTICYKNDGDLASAIALFNALRGIPKSLDLHYGDPDVGAEYIVQVGGATIKGAKKVLAGKDRTEVMINIGKFIEEVMHE